MKSSKRIRQKRMFDSRRSTVEFDRTPWAVGGRVQSLVLSLFETLS